jgi:hypothetical protein
MSSKASTTISFWFSFVLVPGSLLSSTLIIPNQLAYSSSNETKVPGKAVVVDKNIISHLSKSDKHHNKGKHDTQASAGITSGNISSTNNGGSTIQPDSANSCQSASQCATVAAEQLEAAKAAISSACISAADCQTQTAAAAAAADSASAAAANAGKAADKAVDTSAISSDRIAYAQASSTASYAQAAVILGPLGAPRELVVPAGAQTTRDELLDKASTGDDLVAVTEQFRAFTDSASSASPDPSITKAISVPTGSVTLHYLWHSENLAKGKFLILMLKFTDSSGQVPTDKVNYVVTIKNGQEPMIQKYGTTFNGEDMQVIDDNSFQDDIEKNNIANYDTSIAVDRFNDNAIDEQIRPVSISIAP